MERMNRYFRFIAYPLIISLAILNVPFPALAQEDITITTYYPFFLENKVFIYFLERG